MTHTLSVHYTPLFRGSEHFMNVNLGLAEKHNLGTGVVLSMYKHTRANHPPG